MLSMLMFEQYIEQDIDCSRWYDLDKVITNQFPGWTYFETDDAYYKTNSRILPFTGDYRQSIIIIVPYVIKVHLVVSDATVIFGKSLSQTSQGRYEYSMDLLDARVRLYPLSLKLVFKDHRKRYTVVFKYIRDYKFMIRTLKEQIKQRMIDREEYLKLTIKHLHRQNALCVAREKEIPCDKLSKIILEETNKVREPRVKVHQPVHRLCRLARKRTRLKLSPCFWC